MFWFLLIALILGVVLLRFANDYNKDNHDLQDKTLDQKFSVVINVINEAAFEGRGTVTRIDKREFNLYEEGQNQLVKFKYGTGHLYIIWKYKYFQKEVVHERQFSNVRNLSIFDQENIANTMIKEMNQVIKNHKQKVDQGINKEFDDSSNNEVTKENENSDQRPKYDPKAAQQESLERLANFKNLPIDKLKETFFSDMERMNVTPDNFNETLQFFRDEKQLEAEGANIDPNDTASAFLESWLFEYIDAKKKQNPNSPQ